jgi:large conductance mechanosensitive channel
MLEGFRNFLLKGNVVDLAVAVVIGAAFAGIVDGFITAFMDPIILLALSATGASSLETANLGIFPVGVFISAVIRFIIISAVVYFFIVRPFASFAARFTAAGSTPDDVKLLTEIRDLLKAQQTDSRISSR